MFALSLMRDHPSVAAIPDNTQDRKKSRLHSRHPELLAWYSPVCPHLLWDAFIEPCSGRQPGGWPGTPRTPDPDTGLSLTPWTHRCRDPSNLCPRETPSVKLWALLLSLIRSCTAFAPPQVVLFLQQIGTERTQPELQRFSHTAEARPRAHTVTSASFLRPQIRHNEGNNGPVKYHPHRGSAGGGGRWRLRHAVPQAQPAPLGSAIA